MTSMMHMINNGTIYTYRDYLVHQRQQIKIVCMLTEFLGNGTTERMKMNLLASSTADHHLHFSLYVTVSGFSKYFNQ